MRLLVGRRSVISGAGSGIGPATAEVFAREGASVAVLDITPTRLQRPWRASLRKVGKLAPLSATSATKRRSRVRCSKPRRRGAGSTPSSAARVSKARGGDKPADRLSLETWQRTLDANLTGMFLFVKHGLRELLNAGGGSAVLVGSPTGLYGCAPANDAYSASKAGVHGLARVLAADYAPAGIRVNCVLPGYILTPMTQVYPRSEHDATVATIPMRRAGMPHEVAEVIAFLSSDRARLRDGRAVGRRRRHDGYLVQRSVSFLYL